jgi:hypothetical protein
MLEEYKNLKKLPDNSKAGLTIRLNQKDDEDPFEVTVFFRKLGKIRLDIGENGFVEIFAEQTGRLKELETKTNTSTERTEEVF